MFVLVHTRRPLSASLSPHIWVPESASQSVSGYLPAAERSGINATDKPTDRSTAMQRAGV